MRPQVRKRLAAFVLAVAAGAPGLAAPGDERIVVAGIAKPEGPLERQVMLYFVSGDGALLRWDGKATAVVNRTPGCAHNGLALTARGTFLLACMQGGGAILELAGDGRVLRRWDKDDQGHGFAGGINDIAIAPDGGAYATIFGAAAHAGGVLYRAPGSDGWTQVANGLNFANGLAVSADRKTLYVAESVGNRILAYAIDAGGKLGAPVEFARLSDLVKDRVADTWLGPDGLKLDAKGNLFVAQCLGAKILKISPQGRLLHVFDIAAGARVTNLALNADETALFVTVADCASPASGDAQGCVIKIANSD